MVKQHEEAKAPKHPKSKVDRFQKTKEQVEEEAVDEQRTSWKTVTPIVFRTQSSTWATCRRASRRRSSRSTSSSTATCWP